MSIDALAAELSLPEYAAMDDAQAADTINAKRVAIRRHVAPEQLKRAAISMGFYASVRLAASDATTAPETRRLAINILGWIDDAAGTMPPVDLDADPTQAMIRGLVATNLVTRAQADALNALADDVIPWTESVGLPEVGIGLVANARSNNG